MGIFEHIRLLESVHHHIAHKSTGTPMAFASRLNISERTLFRVLEELKDLGAEIVFHKERNSYIYQNEVSFSIRFRIDEKASNNTKGGKKGNYFDPLPYLAVKSSILVVDSYRESPNP